MWPKLYVFSPPGTGKTMLAKGMQSRDSSSFIYYDHIYIFFLSSSLWLRHTHAYAHAQIHIMFQYLFTHTYVYICLSHCQRVTCHIC
jgi:hypothetical protein